ncbi:hypothetical protein [Roseomonas genomospecies 6]|uniref:Uncharacterized protein n=1 Tax=Roseomonas genomospecies 6 TaxID=214106 RepID=A0A9W7NFI3_9PROT|nr:hypothetical protein [Roseomonas genomospecies 6]KAA0677287.1 hypothetical protein DS843_24370 [Roseomonas genomospecies 6]
MGTPFFTKDGRLHQTPGYDEVSRIYYFPSNGFVLPPVSDKPSPEEVARAKGLLLDDVLVDFPFYGMVEAERAHAVAMLLQPFVRQMIEGPTPVYWVHKPAPGTGAGKLINTVSILAVGTDAEAITEERSEDGWRKKITMAMLSGSPLFFLDNVNYPLDSGALASVITQRFWRDRLLGSNDEVNVPVKCQFIMTGNNVTMSGELLRRCVRIFINAGLADPTTRTGFKHPDLEAWVKENRSELVWACLTLIQHWIASGKRKFDGKPLASFEAWSSVMGGILASAGIDGFLANRSTMMKDGNEELQAKTAFVQAWWDRYGGGNVTTGDDLFDIASDSEPALDIRGGTDTARRRSLGMLVRAMKDQLFEISEEGGETITVKVVNGVGNAHKKVAGWRLERQ